MMKMMSTGQEPRSLIIAEAPCQFCMRDRNTLLSSLTPITWGVCGTAAEPIPEFIKAQIKDDGSLTVDSGLGMGKRRSH